MQPAKPQPLPMPTNTVPPRDDAVFATPPPAATAAAPTPFKTHLAVVVVVFSGWQIGFFVKHHKARFYNRFCRVKLHCRRDIFFCLPMELHLHLDNVRSEKAHRRIVL